MYKLLLTMISVLGLTTAHAFIEFNNRSVYPALFKFHMDVNEYHDQYVEPGEQVRYNNRGRGLRWVEAFADVEGTGSYVKQDRWESGALPLAPSALVNLTSSVKPRTGEVVLHLDVTRAVWG